MPAILILSFAYEGLYWKRLPFWGMTREIVKALTLTIVIIYAVVGLGKMSLQVSRLVLLFFYVFALGFYPFFRLMVNRLLFKLNVGKEKAIIFGAGQSGIDAAKGIIKDVNLGYEVIGFLDDDPDKLGTTIEVYGRKLKVLGDTGSFNREFTRYFDISTTVIARHGTDISFGRDVYPYVKRILFMPEAKDLPLLNATTCFLLSKRLLLLDVKNNLKSATSQTLKRAFDIIIGGLLFLPVLIFTGIIALLIKLDSSGGVFYCQERVGKRGNVFRCLKFRTMYEDGDSILGAFLNTNPEAKEEWEKYKKLKSYDPRVTKVGRFLRAASLDELPQIFHVLKGEMSLVGPRPYLPQEIEDMKNYEDYILLTPPGITGIWQVSGRNELSFDDRLTLDTWYVLNWSLWLDMVILLKTLPVVSSRKGAY
jgi:undecaprenyl-phosphate galactose phosphotransferase